jgi:hypothetical protein
MNASVSTINIKKWIKTNQPPPHKKSFHCRGYSILKNLLIVYTHDM